MKKLILITLVLILTSCNTTQQQESSSQLSDEINQKEFIFKKNQECASHKDEMMKDILDPVYLIHELDPVLEEIFYSPKRNSCLYVYRHLFSPDCNKNPDTIDDETFRKCLIKDQVLVDFFTKKVIYTSIDHDNCFQDALNNGDNGSLCKHVSDMVNIYKEE